ncbi:MAG TPA: LacI family DNA-binding transcriptional regulator [Roseiflexaceae bacterium]|nr:LacI family DNA-binding transcriptional regulator [Roseiflexaceae bacterium]
MSSSRASGDVTIIDVAREAGVSYATVSRVINNKGYINPETRERVMRAVTKLGYVVNQQARSLAGGRSQVVGLLVPALDSAYIGEIIRGIDEQLARESYDLMLYTAHKRQTRESTYVGTLTQGLADGLLLVLPRSPSAYIETLRRRSFPYVLIDHQGIDDTGPSVGATNRRGGYEATRYLIELGHRRIGFITGEIDLRCSTDRLHGYRTALAEYGLPDDPALIREGNFQQPSGYAGARDLLALPQPPTAIFASNDVSAFGVMEASRDRGLRIPEDISIVGFDDIPQASHVNPTLTTVRQPLEQMGRLATRMLLEHIRDRARPVERIELSTELIIRGSCRKIGASST